MKFRFTWTKKLITNLSLFCGLLLAATGLSLGQYAGEGTFTPITSLTDLSDGYYVIAYGTTQAMSNSNSGSIFTNTAISLTSGALVDPAPSIVWRIESHASGGRTIYNEASARYVSYTGSSNAAYAVTAVSAGSERWTFNYTGSLFTIANVSTATRFLQYNPSTPRFACYITSSGQQNITLYKLNPVIALDNLGSQVTAANVPEGTANHVLHRFKVGVTVANASLTGMVFSTAGGYDAADITNIKLRYSTDATLDAGDATLSTLSSPGTAGSKTFPSFTNQAITAGNTGYFFITADIANGSASGGNTISVNAVTTGNLTFAGGIKSGATVAGGTQTIVLPSSPTINITGSVGDFGSQCVGTTSASSSYTVGGINLTGNLVITAPSGFEIKTGAGAWGSSVTLIPSAGTVASTTMDVRFAPAAGTAYSSNISHVSTGASTANVSVSGTGTAPVTPALSIISNPAAVSGTTTICGGTSVTFTATPSNLGSGTAGYQWKLNGSDIPGATSPAYTSSALANGSIISCQLTVTGGCVTSSSATSGSITMVVNALPATPSNPVAAANPSCGSTTLGAMTAPGGETYYWQGTTASGTSTANNANAAFAVSATGTYYVRAQQSGCWSAGSGSIAVTVNAAPSITVQPAAQSVVTGNNATFSVTASNATGYQWQVFSGSVWTNISAATSSSYTVTSTTLAMSGTQYRVILSGSAPCTGETSDPATLTVSTGPCFSMNGPSFPVTTGSINAGDADAGGSPTTTTRLATGSVAGSIATNALTGVSGNITVKFRAKGWSSSETSVTVELGGNTQTVTDLPTSFAEVTVTFPAISAGSVLKFSTVAGKRVHIGNVNVYCAALAPEPEIDVKGNGVSIVSGDITPSLADHTDFGSTPVAGGMVIRTFTIENTGTAALNLTSASPYVMITGTHAADFTVTTIPSTPVAAAGSTTFQVTFDPSATGLRTANISIASNDADENPYTFTIHGTGVNSNSSDIIADAAFSYTSNINYTLYQGNPATSSTGVGSFGFVIRDGGGAADADMLGTELTAITFSVANIANVRAAALYSGATLVANGTVSGSTISFSGLSGADVTAPDDGSKTLTLYVSFQSIVTDRQQLQYTIASATASASGSIFAAADAGAATSSITGDRNRLQVTATRLVFSTPPSTTPVNVAMIAPVVSGADANGSIDIDFTGSISITSTGTMTGVTITVTASNGSATFPSVVHTVAETGRTLTAATAGLTGITSGSFDITMIVYNNGDYRTKTAGTWSYNGSTPGTTIWEKYNSGTNSWSDITGQPPTGTNYTAYVTKDTEIPTISPSHGNATIIVMTDPFTNVAPTLTFSSSNLWTFRGILIKTGASMIMNTRFIVLTTAEFEIENGGNFIFSYAANPASGLTSNLWAGIERFRPESNFYVRKHTTGNGNYFLPTDSDITPNLYNGVTAYFGNLIFESDAEVRLTTTNFNNKVITHGDLIFKPAANQTLLYGSVNWTIGRNLVIGTNTAGSGYTLNTATSSYTITFNVKGNFENESANTFRMENNATSTITLNIDKNLVLGSTGILDQGLNTGTSVINLKGDLTVNATAKLFAGNTTNKNFCFTGNVAQEVSGVGTIQLHKITVDKSAQYVSLQRDLQARNELVMKQGHIYTNTNMFELGLSLSQLGTLDYTQGYVVGKMRRWFSGTNSGNAASLFPMGHDAGGLKNRNVKVEYTSGAAFGGHLTVQFIPSPMGMAGIVIPAASSGGFGADVTSTEYDGYWRIDNEASKLTDGQYTISCTGEGFSTINGLGGITLLKRVGASDWTCPGVHIGATGSTSVPTVARSGVSGWSNFGFGGDINNPLPVELTSFSVKCENGSVKARWTTASEKNSDYFILQRSENMENWDEAAQVQAAGSSSSVLHYTTLDPTALRGISYYRLVQVDYNGQRTFYNPFSVSCTDMAEFLSVYPNPSGGDFTVMWNKESITGNVDIQVVSATGTLVSSRSMKAAGGKNMVPFSVALEPGMYYIHLKGESTSETLKLVIR